MVLPCVPPRMMAVHGCRHLPPVISKVLLGRCFFIYSQRQAGDMQPNINRAWLG